MAEYGMFSWSSTGELAEDTSDRAPEGIDTTGDMPHELEPSSAPDGLDGRAGGLIEAGPEARSGWEDAGLGHGSRGETGGACGTLRSRAEGAGRGSADDGDSGGGLGGGDDDGLSGADSGIDGVGISGGELGGDADGTGALTGAGGVLELDTTGADSTGALEGASALAPSGTAEGTAPPAAAAEDVSSSPEAGEFTEVGNEITAYENLIGNINAGFDPYDLNNGYANNCGSCAIATELRLSGANPSAVAEAKQIGTAREMEAITGKTQVSMTPEAIEAYAQAAGPGYHGIVGFDWKGTNDGHWVNVATSASGRVYVLDAQVGRAMLMSEYLDTYARPKATENWDLSR